MKTQPSTENRQALEAATRAFLKAESAPTGREVEGFGASEKALFTLFASLPHAAPSPGFADAVLLRAGLARRDLGWLARLATAAAYALVLVGAVWTLPAALQLLAHLELSAALKTLVDLFNFFAARLGDLVVIAERLAGFGRVLRLILTSPPVVLVSTLCAALTLLMGRWLAALLAVPRSSLHAAVR